MSYPTSRHSSRNVTIANSAEVFEVIREERSPPALSSININATSATSPPVPTTNTCAIVDNSYGNDEEESKDDKAPIVICPCKGNNNQKVNKIAVISFIIFMYCNIFYEDEGGNEREV